MLRWLVRLGLVGIATAAIGVWILPAVPTLPQPDGRYAVATQVYRWTDAAREEPHTADPTDRRSVIAQAWFPTTRSEHPSGVARLAYIDGTDHMPGQVSVMPGFMLHRYGQIDTHAEALAPLAPSDRPWPVVIFSPGYGAPRAVYTGLAPRLASRGFVVFALDHPYESAVTQLPNGRVVGTRETFLPDDRDRTRYMAHQQVVRARRRAFRHRPARASGSAVAATPRRPDRRLESRRDRPLLRRSGLDRGAERRPARRGRRQHRWHTLWRPA
jgi:hypothetical protein